MMGSLLLDGDIPKIKVFGGVGNPAAPVARSINQTEEEMTPQGD